MKKQNVTFTFILLLFTSWNFGQNWNEIIKVVASDRNSNDWFGYSVAISGNYAVIGSRKGETDENGFNPLTSAGCAYVFERASSGTWFQKQKLVSSDRAVGDEFGFSVSISGSSILIGAPQEDEDALGGNYKPSSGSCYVFQRNSSGIWSQTQKIVNLDRGPVDDNFGWSVSISGDNLIVGARQERDDELGANTISAAGAAYIFSRNASGVWIESQKLVGSHRGIAYQFGVSVSISVDMAAVGSFWDEKNSSGGNNLTKAGAVYLFEKNLSGVWVLNEKLVASDRDSNDIFGASVSISGDNLIVGASQEDHDSIGSNSMLNSGAAYIFSKSPAGFWTQSAKLVAADRDINDNFGNSVSISGNRAIVSALSEDEDQNGMNTMSNSGSSYIFEKDNAGNWSEVQKIVASDRQGGDNFGNSVGISNNHIIVGAWFESHDENGGNIMTRSGSCYFFSTPFTLNVQRMLKGRSFFLYPNPTNSKLNIETDFHYSFIKIINSIGQTVIEIDQSNLLDVSFLKRGSYVIQLIGDNKEVLSHQKFVKI